MNADFRLNVYYIMLDKVQSFADGKYDLSRKDIENIYFEQRGDIGDILEEMGITKRGVSTGQSSSLEFYKGKADKKQSSSPKLDPLPDPDPPESAEHPQ
jgi:amphiphysin